MSSAPLRFFSRSRILTSFRSSNAIALTFDDGPDPDSTPQVLKVLRKHGVKATFFVIGRQAELYPDILREILESGSEIGNHTYSHASFAFHSNRSRLLELRNGERAIGSKCKKYFRPPYGHARGLTPFVASMLNYTTVGWSVDAQDWEIKDPGVIAKSLADHVKPGSIVLLHDRLEDAKDSRAFDRKNMLAGLDLFLGQLGPKYSFRTISEMLASCEPVFGNAWDADLDRAQMESVKHDLSELVRNQMPSRPPDNGVFVFAIPLTGRHLTDDFDSICRLLGKTLKSCLRQVDRNFRILIACNEIPKADLVPQDNRIEYIVLKPVNKNDLVAKPRYDVSLKRQALMRAAVDIQARYYFQLDADDLVSNRLVERVRSIGDGNGCVIGKGYLLDSRTSQLYLLPSPTFPEPSFDALCGSSIVVTLLPGVGEEIKRKNRKYLTKVWRLGHNLARDLFLSEGRPARILEFPAAIYRANHGGNLYMHLNADARSTFINDVTASCDPVEGVLLQAVREEFSFLD